MMTDPSHICSFNFHSWSLGFPSWSSLQASEYEITLYDAPLSIWHLRICLLLFVFIRIAVIHPFFFVSAFTISSLTMYVDSLLDDSSKYSRLQNSGARYINNKMLRRFQTFSVCLAICWQKKKKNCRKLSRNLCILLQQQL